jgi:YD repeat-containing protein
VSRTYDNDFRIAMQSVNSTNTVSFGYDADSLLTGSGALTVTRDPQTGLVTGTTLGQVADATAYSDFGEPLTYSASVNGTPVYSVQYAHDLLGRITEKIETVGGATHTYDYAYDLAGRLTDVTTDGTASAHYDFDANSNRIGGFNQLCSSISNAVIDAQDRLSTIDPRLLPTPTPPTASYSRKPTRTARRRTRTMSWGTSPRSRCRAERRSNTRSMARTAGLARKSTAR